MYPFLHSDSNAGTQVDENMQTAQKRNAARAEKFFFRKNIFQAGSSKVSSAGSSSPVSPTSPLSPTVEMNGYFNGLNGNGNGKHKDKKLRNCFPPPPPPEDGLKYSPVVEEYEAMTLEEIMLGKVCTSIPQHSFFTDRLVI